MKPDEAPALAHRHNAAGKISVKADWLILIVLLLLLLSAAAGLVLTRSWNSPAPRQSASKSSLQTAPVNVLPLQTAKQLASLAVTSDEQQYAQEALRISDNEVDLTFDSALREATRHPPALSPAAKELQQRIQRRQLRLDAEQANITRLTSLVAKAPPSKKDALQQELELAQAQESLDEDELADSKQDFIRAGGDPRSKIQEMLALHEQSEVHKGTESVGAASTSKEALVEQIAAHNIVAQFRAWKSLNAKRRLLDAARQTAQNFAIALAQSHEALEGQIEAQQKSATQARSINSSSSAASPAPAPNSPPDAAAAISRVHALSDDQKTLAEFDKRIEDEQALATTYSQWSALVAARERVFLRQILASVFWIFLIASLVFLADVLLRHLFRKFVRERKRFLKLRSVIIVSTRVIGAVLILLVIFGTPSQFATVLALAGAGLTVALKDFIVGFFGWFVLMGKNGIRPGDWVEINGVGGEVFEVGLLHTVLLETGNWSDAGHPTGRKVTFVNSFAIEGHYFNFSTSGQWMWDELQIIIPAGKDPYPIAEQIKKIVAKETETNAHLAEAEWERATLARGSTIFKAEPTMNFSPADSGVKLSVRYITRANERYDLRSRLYRSVLELLHRKRIPQAAEKLSPQPVPDAE